MKEDEFYESEQDEIVDKIAEPLALYINALRQGKPKEELMTLRVQLAAQFDDEQNIKQAFIEQCKVSHLLAGHFALEHAEEQAEQKAQRKISDN